MATDNAKGDLSRYREMRNFAKTPEPAGTKLSPPADRPLRFVIQKHAATRLHYDLRLELDGVFKSWAVTRGPSLDPEIKRLAVHVEDHPLDYGDFEGTIPKGEYGGGTVMLWDRGAWTPEGDPDFGYKKGHLAFRLDGNKLHGLWHLIRTKGKPGDKKEQWLFFKAADAYAQPEASGDILAAAPDSVASGRSIEQIARGDSAVWSSRGGGLTKGRLSPPGKPGKRKQTGKSRDGDPFPGFVAPCLALLAEVPPKGEGWFHEIKFDGYRLLVLIEGGKVRLMTRSGLDWTARFPAILEAFKGFSGRSAILDGEAVVEDSAGVSGFSYLQDALSDGKPARDAVFFAFDLLYLDGKDLRNEPLDDRKIALQRLLDGTRGTAARYSDHIVADGDAMAQHACRLGLEGIVSKKRDAPYRSGRHGEWLKIKCTNRAEFVIAGYVPSSAAHNAVGSLVLGYYNAGTFLLAGRTGTGFTQKSAVSIFKQLQSLRVQKSPFAVPMTAEEKRGVVFVLPECVAEVEFRGWTGDHHLRHAAFKGLREDKAAQEVQLELPAKDAASGNTKTKAAAFIKKSRAQGTVTARKDGAIEFEGVRLTHPDRVLWPGQGLTKLGLAEYYAEVADDILPHIANRPLSLVRCPSGSEGDCFFQKHAFSGLTDAVGVMKLPHKGEEEEALVIRDLRGLISLVQANVLEIHPWGASIHDVERADRLIFDLDPGEGLGLDAVNEGAKDVRERLSSLGIESYVKTSGGKGLHIVVNIAPERQWDDVKTFSHAIARAMEADSPSKYISTMTKAARGGKIFVDYLRNGRGATAVTAFSTRARESAPVSTPIGWDELGPAMTPARFTTSNIFHRLATLKADPWQHFFRNPQHIRDADLRPGRINTARRSGRVSS